MADVSANRAGGKRCVLLPRRLKSDLQRSELGGMLAL